MPAVNMNYFKQTLVLDHFNWPAFTAAIAVKSLLLVGLSRYLCYKQPCVVCLWQGERGLSASVVCLASEHYLIIHVAWWGLTLSVHANHFLTC